MNLQPLTTVNPIWHKIHPDFKLNTVHYNYNELGEIGYSLVKEGEPFENAIGDFLLDWCTEKSTIEVFTSGSTGRPKRISLRKEHMVNSAIAAGKHFGLISGNTALLCLPCSGIAGKMMLVRAMVLGLDLHYVAPTSTPLAADQNHYDFVAMTPMQVDNSLQKLSQIKTLLIGGAPVSTRLREQLLDAPGHIFETYGMTETITHIAVKKLSNVSSSSVENSFKALPDVSISVDKRKCLVINAPKVSDQEIVTNDIVELIDDTSFKWLGRYDSIINSGGVKLIPETIEQKLGPFIQSRFFVAGIPDKLLGQKLVLVVEGLVVSDQKLLSKIRASEVLDKYEIPKEIYSLKTFEETTTGKIHRENTLRQIRQVL